VEEKVTNYRWRILFAGRESAAKPSNKSSNRRDSYCPLLWNGIPADATKGQTLMSGTIINLIIQIVGGIIGGNGIGAALKDINLGTLGNTIAGGVGGAAGGTILSSLIPALAGAAGGGVDIGSMLGQLAGGGASGAALTAIVGVIKNMMAGQSAR